MVRRPSATSHSSLNSVQFLPQSDAGRIAHGKKIVLAAAVETQAHRKIKLAVLGLEVRLPQIDPMVVLFAMIVK